MNSLLLTFDLEQFVTPEEKGMNIPRKELFRISNEGLERIYTLLKETQTKATFFTTLEFAKQSLLLKKIVEEGHEIALHGYEHNIHYHEMKSEEALQELKKAKEELERLFAIKIKGLRTPQMRTLNFQILKKLGIAYDSSLHPTYIPGYKNDFFKTRRIKEKEGIKIVPVSVVPLIKAPFSWIWFRNLGLFYVKCCTKLCLLADDRIHLYFHPWDFADLNKEPFKGRIFPLILRNSGKKAENQLKEYILWCRKKGLKSRTLSDYLRL